MTCITSSTVPKGVTVFSFPLKNNRRSAVYEYLSDETYCREASETAGKETTQPARRAESAVSPEEEMKATSKLGEAREKKRTWACRVGWGGREGSEKV